MKYLILIGLGQSGVIVIKFVILFLLLFSANIAQSNCLEKAIIDLEFSRKVPKLNNSNLQKVLLKKQDSYKDVLEISNDIFLIQKELSSEVGSWPNRKLRKQIQIWMDYHNQQNGYLPGGTPSFNFEKVAEMVDEHRTLKQRHKQKTSVLHQYWGNTSTLSGLDEVIKNTKNVDEAYEYFQTWREAKYQEILLDNLIKSI